MLFTKDCALFICLFPQTLCFTYIENILYCTYTILKVSYTFTFGGGFFFANKKTYNTAAEQKSELHKVGLGISLKIVLTVLVK